MYVCFCAAVTDETINLVVDDGASSLEDVIARCRAGSGCGGCHSHLELLIAAREAAEERLVAAS